MPRMNFFTKLAARFTGQPKAPALEIESTELSAKASWTEIDGFWIWLHEWAGYPAPSGEALLELREASVLSARLLHKRGVLHPTSKQTMAALHEVFQNNRFLTRPLALSKLRTLLKSGVRP